MRRPGAYIKRRGIPKIRRFLTPLDESRDIPAPAAWCWCADFCAQAGSLRLRISSEAPEKDARQAAVRTFGRLA
jgi:hypothetical protein